VAFVEESALIVVAAAIFLWGAVSARLERADLTAPIVFTAIGAALAGLDLVHASSAPEKLKPLIEVTLVWVLFSDAARVRVHDLRRDLGGVLRLLAIGLPLTVLAGWGLAAWLIPGLGSGWPCWSVRRWPRPTPPWAFRSSPTRRCRPASAG
jgi:NhaP-type Na+/H+ or K+/H+ antiporter